MTRYAWEAAYPLDSDKDPEPLAVCLRALSSPARLRIVKVLADLGPLQRSQLREAVGTDPVGALEALERVGIVERVWHQGERIEWRLVAGAVDRVAEMLRS